VAMRNPGRGGLRVAHGDRRWAVTPRMPGEIPPSAALREADERGGLHYRRPESRPRSNTCGDPRCEKHQKAGLARARHAKRNHQRKWRRAVAMPIPHHVREAPAKPGSPACGKKRDLRGKGLDPLGKANVHPPFRERVEPSLQTTAPDQMIERRWSGVRSGCQAPAGVRTSQAERPHSTSRAG
jgi:hypothetical protein